MIEEKEIRKALKEMILPALVLSSGGWSAHGGGAFSGKDLTKMYRSAAEICWQMAKTVVRSGRNK